MSDNAAKIANEKLKGLALMVRNGAILVAAPAFAKWYTEGAGIVMAVWLVISIVMAYVGTELLSLLQPED